MRTSAATSPASSRASSPEATRPAGRVSGNQGANNIWSVDGIDITDPAALGGSALYYDFDMFEELNVTVGGAADVTVQTGGVALNMVTRRGGNRMSLAGRFYLTDNFFQSTNITPELQAQGVLDTNKIQEIKDYGFNAGGPIIKDKLWWWGAYGVQDIFTWTLPNRTGIGAVNAGGQEPGPAEQLQLQAQRPDPGQQPLRGPGHLGRQGAVRAERGRRKARRRPPEGKYHWGSPVIKLQDEHVFGNNFFLSLKYSFNGRRVRLAADPGREDPVPHRLRQHPGQVRRLRDRHERQLGLLRRVPPAEQLPDPGHVFQRHASST